MPLAVQNLVGLTRVRQLCEALDVARVDIGPRGVALAFGTHPMAPPDEISTVDQRLAWHDGRLVNKTAVAAEERVAMAINLLDRLLEAKEAGPVVSSV